MVDIDKPSVFPEDPLATSMKSIQSIILTGRITIRAMVKGERREPKIKSKSHYTASTYIVSIDLLTSFSLPIYIQDETKGRTH